MAGDKRQQVGAAIAEAFERNDDVTQKSLAAEVGKDQTTVSAWKRGRAMPPPELWMRIERHLRMAKGTIAAIAQDGERPIDGGGMVKRREALDRVRQIREALRDVEDALRE